MKPLVGQVAPDFKAEGYFQGEFQQYQLSDYRGQWVLLCFYPGDFTFVCPTELVSVGARIDELKELNVQPLAFSVDSKFVHKIWDEVELSKMLEGGLTFPMLSDPDGEIGTAYGVFNPDEAVDIRGRFLIDPDGVIQAAEILNPPVGRNISELIRQIKAFQHARKTGEVCPAGWQPGDVTLKPGPDLVGRVWEKWSLKK